MRPLQCLAMALALLPTGVFAADSETVTVNLPLPDVGLPLDARAAHLWLEVAARQGNAQAQLQLAMRYESGDSVAQDVALAMSWYEKAAAQGLVEAQRILGILYLSGLNGLEGTAREEAGFDWLRQAAAQGDAFAASLVDFYAGKMEARAVAALRLCHQQALAHPEQGWAARDSLAAAVQARCAGALEAWIFARFPDLAVPALPYLRAGAQAAQHQQLLALVTALQASGRPAAETRPMALSDPPLAGQ